MRHVGMCTAGGHGGLQDADWPGRQSEHTAKDLEGPSRRKADMRGEHGGPGVDTQTVDVFG